MEVILLLIRIFLFAVFAVAAVGKLLDLKGSAESAKAFGTPADLAKTFAILIPFAELVFAICLLFVGFSWIGAIGVLLLLVIFSGGMIAQMAQGKSPDCHCFGAIHSEPVSKKSLIRNIIFAILAFFLIVSGKSNQGLSLADLKGEMAIQLFLGLATIGLLGAVVFYLKKISEQQTQIMRRIEVLELVAHEGGVREVERENVGSPHDSLPIGAIAPAFELPDVNGKIVSLEKLRAASKPLWFFFVSPNCTPCQALLPEIEEWQSDLQDKVEFVFVSSGKPEANTEKFGANFKYVLLQDDKEVSALFHARWTPTAVFINADGIIASHLAVGDSEIRDLAKNVKAIDFAQKTVFIANGSKTKLGAEMPEFSMPDVHGKTISSADFRGKKTLVTFWSATCPHCLNMIRDLQEWDREKGADEPDLLVFSEGDAEEHREIGLQSPIILDEGYKTSEKFGMAGTPSAVLINENGRIISETAIGAGNIWALIGKRR